MFYEVSGCENEAQIQHCFFSPREKKKIYQTRDSNINSMIKKLTLAYSFAN